MDAQAALELFLGRLTTVLVNEAPQLGRVRGDVEFIKDEMESMNGLIFHLTEAQLRDHQVRTWMRQVVGLTGDCEGNVELYVHYVGSRPGGDGLLGFIRRIPWFLQTVSVRRRIATRIQELRVRARDVGDRRQRYGVIIQASTTGDMDVVDVEPSVGKVDLRRRAVLLDGADEPPSDDKEVIRSGIDTLIKCLSMKPRTTEDGLLQPQVRVFKVSGRGLEDKVAEGVYQQHSSVASIFGCKAWSDGRKDVHTVLADILEQVGGVKLQRGHTTTVNEKQLITKLQMNLKGKRFLIVVNLARLYRMVCKRLLDALLEAADVCLPGSAIVMTKDYNDQCLCKKVAPAYKVINVISLTDFYLGKLYELNANRLFHTLEYPITTSSAFARKLFLHLLYAKPTMTDAEKDMCRNAISKGMSLYKSVDHTMVMLCYNELPSKYRSCLLHLTIFPQGHVIKTTRLIRRWIAEGLVTTTSDETESAEDKAGHYLDVMFIRGFISPVEISATCKVKSFTLKDEVHNVIAKIAREVNIVDTNLPVDLAHHLSIHNRIGLGKSHSYGGERKDIAAYLPSMAKSPQWQLLKVLDLEGCHGLDKQHVTSICKILLLKYLSLRNTDVAELPKQIKELQCLETLDVRETKVRVLAKKHIVLPQLKHFLAGHRISGSNSDLTLSEDLFSAVQMPLSIEKMNNMEVLSHVRVSTSNELASIAQLLKLKKLGVALHGNHAKLSDLFCQIEKLHGCLRSLSIRIERQGASKIQDVGMVDPLRSIPQFIERLNISGITCGLRHLIQEQNKLTKITLYEIHLKEDDLTVLGKLGALQFIRLQQNSYTESEIVFREEEFQRLNYLLIEGKNITKIRFASGAAPKLGRIVWSFATMDALSGLKHLKKLKKLELNGDCDLHPIEEELFWHPNNPTLKHKPYHQRPEDKNADPTPASSAP